MVIMHTANFLNVLFLTDVYGLDAIELGLFATIFSGAIFATTQLGGQLSDRMHCRWLVGGSFAIMICALAGLALFPLPLLGAAALMLVQSLGGGLAMAALHRAAMEEIPTAESGSAAGLYSTARIWRRRRRRDGGGGGAAAVTIVCLGAGRGLPVGIRRGRGDQSGESGGGVEVGAVEKAAVQDEAAPQPPPPGVSMRRRWPC